MINLLENNHLKHIIKYRPDELNRVIVDYKNQKRNITCFCGSIVSHSIVPHFKNEHSLLWKKWRKNFIKLSNLGFSLKDIMKLFCDKNGKLLFSWTVIEKSIREVVENGEAIHSPAPKKRITKWEPENFTLEKTTVWDFPQRGNWAVHQGNYRGNWPPQVPRNLIKRYTKEGDIVVDAFSGGGTTLIEAWLLNRRSIGLDISKLAIQNTNQKLKDMYARANEEKVINLNPIYRPLVLEENSLELSVILAQYNINRNEVKLVCAHPPYLNSIKYTNNIYDLAMIHDVETFGKKIQAFAKEVKKILAPDGICAVLIGDIRKNKKIIPLGFKVLNSFLIEGFDIENIIIKTQHRDKSSEFWVGHKSNLILMAHEYLLIMKPKAKIYNAYKS
jgi:DNA modification methylase